jgi:ribosome biogenesis protein YTM1
MVAPSSLARYGLSEIINRLLSFDDPVPFDFIINGEYLRTSVLQYLEAHNLSSEKTLHLEYVFALTEPERSQVDNAPDWISSIFALGPVPTPWFAAACYDGTLRVYEGAETRLVAKLSDRPLTALTALASSEGSTHSCLLAAASKDGTTRCCSVQYGAGRDVRLGSVASLQASTGVEQSVEAVAFSEDGTLLASAGWNHDVQVWNADAALFAAPRAEGLGSKRKEGGADAGLGREPKFTLSGHSQVVSCLRFGERDRFPFTLFSGSWDSSMRVWDIAAATCVCNWTVARAVTSCTVSPDSPQIATSHEDGHISLWDIRAPPHPSARGAVALDVTAGLPLLSAQVPHRRLASQVAWSPLDATRLASVGHDGQLCVLDPRSPKMPLQSLRLGADGPCPTKLLSLCWLDKESLAIGGSDGKVVRVSLTSGGAAADVHA